jgi:small-conductance mechanosensitive channel
MSDISVSPNTSPLKRFAIVALCFPIVVLLFVARALSSEMPSQPTATAIIAKGPLSAALDHVQQHLNQLYYSWRLMPPKILKLNSVVAAEFADKGWLAVALLATLFVLLGATLVFATWRLTRPLRLWTIAQPRDTAFGRLRRFGGRLLFGTLMVASFVVGSAGSFLLFPWPPLLREIVLALLSAAIAMWTFRMLARIALLPSYLGVPDAHEVRAFDITDEAADHWYRWSTIFVDIFSLVATIFALLPIFGFTFDDILALAVPVDLVLLVVVILAIWLRPKMLPNVGSRSVHISSVAISWLLTGYFILLFAIRTSGALPVFWTAVTVVALPSAIAIARHAVRYIFRHSETEEEASPLVGIAVADRAIRLVLIAAAAFGLAGVWGVDLSNLGRHHDNEMQFLPGILDAVLILLGADFGWSIVKAIIERELGSEARGDASEVAFQQHTRVRTLLPIIQNILFAVIVILATLMVLASIGIQIGPLIAGAGVIGVAVGFGAQTLVKDVISGIFYLFDDAFRVGEYISSGKYMGTVESFSLRSVKLRHHRGPLFTIPFGELGAVQNQSRDWSTDKFNITVRYETDIETARKLVKKLGQELADDPEFAPWVIEPIKMQGVQEFGEHGIVLRMKYTTRPGGALGMKRRFYIRVREVFKEANIELPLPAIQFQSVAPQPTPSASNPGAADR